MSDTVFAFVYGTLRSGEVNDIARLAPPARRVGFGTVRGDLFDYGRHPGIVLRDDGPPVLGEVYACAPALIAVLDDIELRYPTIPGLYRQAWRDVDCGVQRLRCLVYEVTDGGQHAQGRIDALGLHDWVSFRLAREALKG